MTAARWMCRQCLRLLALAVVCFWAAPLAFGMASLLRWLFGLPAWVDWHHEEWRGAFIVAWTFLVAFPAYGLMMVLLDSADGLAP